MYKGSTEAPCILVEDVGGRMGLKGRRVGWSGDEVLLGCV